MLVILQLRIRALYGRRSRIPAWVGLAFVMEIALLVFLSVQYTVHITCASTIYFRRRYRTTIDYSEVRPGLIACETGDPPPHSYSFFFPIIAFEGLLFVLAFRITYQHYKHFRSSIYWRPLTLLELLLRDNFIYFFV